MIKQVLLTGALLTVVATIGCSDYVLQPENPRFDAGVAVNPPSEPRIDVVRDAADSPRGIADYSDQDVAPPTPPDLDIEKIDVIDSLRDTQATVVPPSPPRMDLIELVKIEMRRP